MYCRVFACDFDGTGAANGRLAPEIVLVLRAARSQGYTTLLVTGRVIEDLQAADVDFGAFDAVVAENGAIVWLPAANRTVQLGTPPPDEFLAELRARGIPYHAGAVVVGTWDRHAGDVLQLIRRFGLASQLVFNREAMMVLPSGVDKAVGVERALGELHRSARNLVAFGDAENDRALLEMAEVGVAARGAVPSIARIADDSLSHPGPPGVAQHIQGVLQRGGHVATPPRQRIILGVDEAGRPLSLPGSGTNVVISGDPRSGKSWLAGLVAERLIERGYRLCIIDPEGDYLPLGQRPGVLTLGNDLPLPDPATLPKVLRNEPLSLVLNLAALSAAEKARWVERALPSLEVSRTVTGVPHWIVLDEAHYFLNERAAGARAFETRTGSYLFATYRPSLVASVIHESIGSHLVTRTTVEEERYFLTGLLQARGPQKPSAADALAGLEAGKVGCLRQRDGEASWHVFTPAPRAIVQAHHGRKYADTRLPDEKAFLFRHANATHPTAHSVAEFCAAVSSVPGASLRHHLLAGDFSRWAADSLGDARLAAAFRKLEQTTRVGAPPSRTELLTHVKAHYLM
jgi:hydroxymethylpyrimidine pyrophosphatase-like HAD family hydrolase